MSTAPIAAIDLAAQATAPIAGPTQQKLLGLEVLRLKGLADMSLDFTQTALTAIMGSNCSGKTTVLHALACAHKPLKPEGPDYRFPLFFRPNTDALWKDSNFTVRYSHRIGSQVYQDLQQNYIKTTDRWSPRYDRRPPRYTRFVNIGESVPDIETMNLNSMIHYQKTEATDSVANSIRTIAGQVLNKDYEAFYKITYDYLGKLSIAVRTQAATYSGLSMSSGEQRVFRILDAVLRAPKYALILVDEIDLFLHQDALQRLLGKLQEHCTTERKQLIFTTHFPPVAQMYDKICIYSLNRVPSRTVVWRGYSYEAMCHITGRQERPILCYVEDDVADQIVARVASELGIRKFVQIGRYGPAENAFSLCAGLQLANQSMKHTLAVLDGDVYGTASERRDRIGLVLTGNMHFHDHERRKLQRLVRTLAPAKSAQGRRYSPEQMLHRMLRSLDRETIAADRREVFDIAQGVVNVPEKHGFLNEIIDRTGESRANALLIIVGLASSASEWRRYTRVVRAWLTKQKFDLKL